MEKDKNTKQLLGGGEKITRKEAIKKAGVTALTAASVFFLETKPAAAQSPNQGSDVAPASAPTNRDRPQAPQP